MYLRKSTAFQKNIHLVCFKASNCETINMYFVACATDNFNFFTTFVKFPLQIWKNTSLPFLDIHSEQYDKMLNYTVL